LTAARPAGGALGGVWRQLVRWWRRRPVALVRDRGLAEASSEETVALWSSTDGGFETWPTEQWPGDKAPGR
jgi:hypothetical protein